MYEYGTTDHEWSCQCKVCQINFVTLHGTHVVLSR